MNKKTLSALVLALGIAGCATSPSFSRFLVAGEPSVTGLVPTQSRMLVSITRAFVGLRAVQNVSPLTFTNADLTLSNGTLLSGPVTRNISLASNATSSAAVFEALRPGGDYALDVALKNDATQVGTGYGSGISLPAGVTTSVTIVVGADGELEVSSSAVGNAFGSAGSWLLAKGDTVTLGTGFAAVETGVSYMLVKLDAGLYGSASTIAKTTEDFDTFSWTTGTDATANGVTYTAANLTTGGAQNGTITFELYNASDDVIGRTRLTGVSVVAGAGMDLQLQ